MNDGWIDKCLNFLMIFVEIYPKWRTVPEAY